MREGVDASGCSNCLSRSSSARTGVWCISQQLQVLLELPGRSFSRRHGGCASGNCSTSRRPVAPCVRRTPRGSSSPASRSPTGAAAVVHVSRPRVHQSGPPTMIDRAVRRAHRPRLLQQLVARQQGAVAARASAHRRTPSQWRALAPVRGEFHPARDSRSRPRLCWRRCTSAPSDRRRCACTSRMSIFASPRR